MHRSHRNVLILLLASPLVVASCAAPNEPSSLMTEEEAESTGVPAHSGSSGDGSVDGEDSPHDGGSTDGEGSSGGAEDIEALYDCEDPDALLIPFSGPAFDPDTGEFAGALDRAYWASTTQAVVSPESMADFMEMNDAVVVDLMQSPGLLGVGFAVESKCGFLRTLALWEDQRSMFAFVASESHAVAMSRAPELSITGKTTSWSIEGEALPLTWSMAFDVLADIEPSPIYD